MFKSTIISFFLMVAMVTSWVMFEDKIISFYVSSFGVVMLSIIYGFIFFILNEEVSDDKISQKAT